MLTLISYWFFQYFLLVGHFFSNRFMHPFLIQKTYQKPFQNQVRTLSKSMPKTCCFLTSIFSGLGLDLGASWASKLEPSWLLKRKKITWGAPWSDLKLSVFKKWRLGGLRARFWRPRGSISEGLRLRKGSFEAALANAAFPGNLKSWHSFWSHFRDAA